MVLHFDSQHHHHQSGGGGKALDLCGIINLAAGPANASKLRYVKNLMPVIMECYNHIARSRPPSPAACPDAEMPVRMGVKYANSGSGAFATAPSQRRRAVSVAKRRRYDKETHRQILSSIIASPMSSMNTASRTLSRSSYSGGVAVSLRRAVRN